MAAFMNRSAERFDCRTDIETSHCYVQLNHSIQYSKWKFRSVGILIKAKQGYTVKKMGKFKWLPHVLIVAGMKFRNRKRLWYGVLAYTGQFREMIPSERNELRPNPLNPCSNCVYHILLTIRNAAFYVYMFRMILTINGDYFPEQY
jgi:hypothetical protein